MLAGRALPAKESWKAVVAFTFQVGSFLSQTQETQGVWVPLSCRKILPTPLKTAAIPFHSHVQRMNILALYNITLSTSWSKKCVIGS